MSLSAAQGGGENNQSTPISPIAIITATHNITSPPLDLSSDPLSGVLCALLAPAPSCTFTTMPVSGVWAGLPAPPHSCEHAYVGYLPESPSMPALRTLCSWYGTTRNPFALAFFPLSFFLSFVQAMGTGQRPAPGLHCPARVGQDWLVPSFSKPLSITYFLGKGC